MKHFAAIDLGTNTFHILIVRKTMTLWEEVYRKRVFVNIAEGGIETISPICYQRGLDTILGFHQKIKEYDIKQISTFGTAALRTATNGPAFQSEVKQRTGLEIQIIDGQREAQLIAKGTKAIVDMSIGNYLIMDIGGGSVEFILVQNNQENYIESFPIGITSLHRQFPHSEPISDIEIASIDEYLSKRIAPLRDKIENLTIEGLVGASGSYEVLEKILSDSITKNSASKISINRVTEQIDRILKLDLSARLADPDIPNQRAKLIVIAVLLMKHVLGLCKFNSMIISPFALKEGALLELMDLD